MFFASKMLRKAEVKYRHKNLTNINNLVLEDKKILFGVEYYAVNRLAWRYDTQMFAQKRYLELEKDVQLLEEAASGIAVLIANEYYHQALLSEIEATSFMPNPTDWMTSDQMKFASERRFPSSKLGKSEYWAAHRHGKIVAAAGLPRSRHYQKYPGENYNNDLKQFFRFILKEKPGQILALGQCSNDFANYIQPIQIDEYTLVVVDTEQGKKLILSDGKTTHSFYYNNINVADNASINLDYAGFKTLLAIYNNCDDAHPVLIHCASGVGRTGQVRLLFALLDKIATNENFKMLVDKLIDDIQLSSAEEKLMIGACKQALNSLRKIRYAVQSLEQYLNCVPLLLLLRAVQLGRSESFVKELQVEMSGLFMENMPLTPFISTIQPPSSCVAPSSTEVKGKSFIN